MAKDYYGILGVSRDADDGEIKRAYRKLVRELHPDVNPDDETQAKFHDVKSAYEVLTDPQKRRIVDLGGDPLETARGGGGGAGGFSSAGFGGLGDIMDAFFGAAGATGGRGPRSRVQPGEDALIRIDLTLEECATGVARDLTVDTAVLCEKCHGGGAEPGTHTETCDTCDGRGEIQNVQRSFIGQVVTARACPVCRGTGEIIPQPLQPVRRRRARALAADRHRAGAGRRRRRHAHPDGQPGRGRPRRRAGGRPLHRGLRGAPRVLHPRRRRPALPRQPADDGGGAGHHAPAAHPRGRRGDARSSPARRRTRR